ncbi:endo-1,4-beta-xylanase 5-like [Impatiens glandulifera]|uniref:endo-1,4-beta-xylanase 5-like n=1 Tax=Impatiens glandulifera TaxID=253017 RepID=UPI001FB09F02|nr:endo-1,4-beta-xylanase 5-like [Impatiens glandulifera]
MKWYSTEATQGREDYTVADSMLNWAKSQRLLVRGHNVLWDEPKYQVGWLNSLSGKYFYQAVVQRIKSIVTRYSGQLIAWDAVNENMHFNYFESRLGTKNKLFNIINSYDNHTPLFLNEFNTIEQPTDKTSSPDAYMKRIQQIRDNGYHGPLGIGLESHFTIPNLAYMRASIDKLATLRLPIWLTELDVGSYPNTAILLDQVLREGHGHPAVEGLVIWAGWKPTGCYRMCLTDNNFNNLPTGDVVDRFLREFIHTDDHLDVTDDMGYFEARLFHGEYSLRVNNNTTLERYKNLNETKEFGFNSVSSSPQASVEVAVVDHSPSIRFFAAARMGIGNRWVDIVVGWELGIGNRQNYGFWYFHGEHRIEHESVIAASESDEDESNDELVEEPMNDNCKVCGLSRWKINQSTSTIRKKVNGKFIPNKVLRYFPLKPRLQRLFMCSKIAPMMTWHKDNNSEDDVMRHLANSMTWKTFDNLYPDFAADPQNVRLSLASDGFQPFANGKTSYSI